jgi:hypothetical protein
MLAEAMASRFAPQGGEPTMDAATLFSEVQQEIRAQHRQLAALDDELAAMHARVLEGGAEETELQKEKNRELLAFMKVHALVVDRERRVAEGALKNSELWREMEELQSACAQDAADAARLSQLAQSARDAYEAHVASTTRVERQWRAEAGLLGAECESELRRLRSLDDDFAKQSSPPVEASPVVSGSVERQEEPAPPGPDAADKPGEPAVPPAAPQARPPPPPVSRDEAAPAEPMQIDTPSPSPSQPQLPTDLRALIVGFIRQRGRADVAMVLAYCSAHGVNVSILQVVNALDALAAEFHIYRDGSNGFRLL